MDMPLESKATTCIIGAGLQGCCIALALASKGLPSTILDAAPEAMSGASLINEGKIHLGFVYALDTHGRTQDLMLKGALHFAPFLDRWCNQMIPWRDICSDPFVYGVMPDSLLSPREIKSSYRQLDERLQQLNLNQEHYLGHSLSRLWSALEDKPAADSAICFFQTAERSVDPRALAKIIRSAVSQSPMIQFIPNTLVTACEPGDRDVLLRIDQAAGKGQLRVKQAINCTWGDQERLDRMAGLPAQKLNYRVKHQILVKPHSTGLRATTLVQGPYGDLVPWPDGTVYLSWYPVGRTYFAETPPDHFPDKEERNRIAEKTVETMSGIFPELRGAEILSCSSGIIVGRGDADVEQKGSQLHRRDQIGVRSRGRWMSVNPGKLTTAPWFAEQAVQQIVSERRIS